MKNKNLISIFLTMAMLVNMLLPFSAFAAEEPKVYLNDGFGSYTTNLRSPEGYTVLNQQYFAVEEYGARDKIAKFAADGKVSIEKTFAEVTSREFVVSTEVVSYSKAPSYRVLLMSGTASVELYSVKNGTLYISGNNKNVASITPAGKSKLDAVVDSKYNRVSFYIDGKLKLKEWKIAAVKDVYSGIKIEQTGSSEMGISSIAVYDGKKPDAKITDVRFNPDVMSDFYLEKDGSDMTYFHSKYIVNTKLQYPNTSFTAKPGNSYTAEALINWKNPNKGERIILTKNNDDTSYNDVFFSVSTAKKGGYFQNPNSTYKYWMLCGNLMITDLSVGGIIMLMRDTTSGSYQEFNLRMRQGAICDNDYNPLSGVLDVDRYYYIECYLDLESHVFDLYLDGELLAQDLPVPETVNTPSMYRCSLDKGKGSWIIRDWELRGMTKRYGRTVDENGKVKPVVYKTSKFSDNEVIKEYLADKIVFHGDGNMYYKDGQKVPFTKKSVYENNELYIAPEDFNKAHGTNIAYDTATGKYVDGDKTYSVSAPKDSEGAALYPAKELTRALGLAAEHNGYGSMVIVAPDAGDIIETGDKDMPWFDSIYYNEGTLGSKTMVFTDAQEISNFVFYDRPDAAKIEEDFYKTMGENPGHPRIMINKDDVTRLRCLMETDSYFRNLADNILAQVEGGDMQRPIVTYGDSQGTQEMNDYENMRTLGQAFKLQNMERVALAYILTGDTKYSDKAVEQLMYVVDTFPDLNPNHIIDLGSWLRPISIIYDWCYDAMTPEQRADAAKFIEEKGLEPVNRTYYSQNPATGSGDFNSFQTSSWFPTWKSNYVSYTQGGVVPAALAVAEHCPEVAFDTLEKCLRAYEYEHFGFYPGGVWLEGKSYQTLINNHDAYAFGSMLKTVGTEYNMLHYRGVRESLHAMMSYSSLTGAFSFADDSGKGALAGSCGAYSFFGSYYNDPVLSMWRQLGMRTEYAEKYNTTGSNASILDIVYYEPPVGDEVLQNFEHVRYFEGGEIFTVHEDWLDKNAMFFATAGGPTLFYHRHYDAGDFYFDKDNVTWSYEFGQGDYNVGSIWTRFGGRSEAHNTITINNSNGISMKESSFVPVIAQGEGSGGAYVVYDMKELYAHHGTEKMHRGFYIGDNYESLRVRDEMSFSQDVTGYWHFHTEANVKQIDDETMLLSKNGKSMLIHLNIENKGNFKTEFSVNKARPLPESPNLEKDAQNKTNVNQIRVKFVGNGDINITVEFFDNVRPIDTTPTSQWVAPEKTAVDVSKNYDFGYDLVVDGKNIGATDTIPVINNQFSSFEVIPHDSRVKAEIIDKDIKAAETPILVKLTGDDGESVMYSVVKYSQYGALVKDLLFNELEIKDYWVSSEPEPANHKANMFDGDMNTRLCMYFDNALATFDLGEVKAVDGIALAMWKGNIRNYYLDLEVSTDGANFKKVGEYSSSGVTEDYEFFTFPTEQARYVRFVGHMSSGGDTNNLNELRVIQKK
ncbi:MAG: heparinase II/III family protein [Clostridia bacterium]|nr:heparinase II/III family protein [Clostridia bacterium]